MRMLRRSISGCRESARICRLRAGTRSEFGSITTPRWEAAIDVGIEWRLMPVRKPCDDTREFLSSEPPSLGW